MDQPQTVRTGVVQDYLDALGVLRSLRTLVVALLVLALAMQIWLYMSVSRGRLVVNPPESCAVVPATEEPSDNPASQPTTAAVVEDGPTYHASCVLGIRIALPVARFLGLVCAGLLVVCLFVGLFICLAGRLGGAKTATAGLIWSALLVLVLFPWQSLIAGVDVDVPCAFMTFAQLQAVPDVVPTGTVAVIAHYLRYVGWPALAILLALISCWRFGATYKAVQHRLAGG